MVASGDVSENLPLDQSTQVAFTDSLRVSIMYLCASRASSGLPAERNAWHRFWCVVRHKDSRSQPKSWTKHSVMKSTMYASYTHHGQVLVSLMYIFR
jgi:hypothetical protein